MSAYRPTDDDISTAEWLAGQTQVHQTAPATRPAGAPTDEPFSAPQHEPVYADRPVLGGDDEYGEDRQRERYGGLNWGAGVFGWLVAAGLMVVLTGGVAAAVAALGLTDQVLTTDAGRGPGVEAIVIAATLFGSLLVAYYAGGYVAGRMSRFDGGKQGVAVWLTGLLVGGAGAGLGLLADAKYGTFDHLSLPTIPVPAEADPLSGVITAIGVLFTSLLVAVVGGKVGCRYHRKVDDAAYL